MSKIRTHYDNLKVARDAPPEVIRAAYKGLSQKYHPDRNQGDKNSEKIMRLINQAYEVLSDPIKRKAHDEWILSIEETDDASNHIKEETKAKPENTQKEARSERDPSYPLHWAHYLKKYKVNEDHVKKAVASGMVKGALYDGVLYLEDKPPYGMLKKSFINIIPKKWGWYLFGAFVIYAIFTNDESHQASNTNSTTKGKDPVQATYKAPTIQLPYGGEIRSFSTAARVAPLEIKSSGDSNYLVKLKSAYGNSTVLTVFIRGGSTVNIKVPLGTYEILYASGKAWYGYNDLFGPQTSYSKADRLFKFQDTGTQVTGYTITLYRVSNGNLHTSSINASDF